MKGNGSSTAIRMAKLLVRSALANFDEAQNLQSSNDLARLQHRQV